MCLKNVIAMLINCKTKLCYAHKNYTFTPVIKHYYEDIFDKIKHNRGPLGQHAKESHGYFTFPKLEGEIAPIMKFGEKMYLLGVSIIIWGYQIYLK